jgi:hypothetical protein
MKIPFLHILSTLFLSFYYGHPSRSERVSHDFDLHFLSN